MKHGKVAPVRERGLKFYSIESQFRFNSRSREGAWIEMIKIVMLNSMILVAPVRERGLKLLPNLLVLQLVSVAPVRERGLKSNVSLT